MTQLPMTQLGPEASQRSERYVTAREFREFAERYAKEFNVRQPEAIDRPHLDQASGS